MKIYTNQGPQDIIKQGQKTSEAVSGAEFKNILEQRLQAVSGASPVSPVSETAAVHVPPALRIESLSVAENTINSLELFGSALKDLHLPGNSLEPFVEALEEETGSILQLKDQLPPEDPLAQFLDRVASISYVEVAKYRRGDYQ